MPDLRQVHRSEEEIRYSDQRPRNWVLLAFGVLAAYLGWAGEGGGRGWFLFGFGVLLVLLGLFMVFHRVELTLDLLDRRYRYRRGWWWALEEGDGPFDDIETVVIEKDMMDEETEWEVELVIDGWSGPVEVMETGSEDVARSEARELASLLDAGVEERTEG